jgi:cell division protein FtsQ
MKRKWIFIILLVALAIILLVTMAVHRGEKREPIKHVSVTGELTHVNQAELKRLVQPLVNGQNFFHAKLKQIAAEVQTIPWVAHAEVSRIWPDSIAIHVNAQQPVAVWNQIGLITDQGNIFYPSQSSFPVSAPNFYAPSNKQAAVVLKNYQTIKQMLNPLQLAPTTIRVDSDNSWEVTLSNNIKLQLGSKDILTKLQHFVKVYSKVFGKSSRKAQVVDLRYPNGMAVQWKK